MMTISCEGLFSSDLHHIPGWWFQSFGFTYITTKYYKKSLIIGVLVNYFLQIFELDIGNNRFIPISKNKEG